MGFFERIKSGFKEKPKAILQNEMGESSLEGTTHVSGSGIQHQIAEQIKKYPILLYMKGNRTFPQCGFSKAIVDILNQCNVTYETIDVLEKSEIREGIKDYSDWPTIPQLYVSGKFIGGCDIVREMFSKGELEPLIRSAPKPKK